MIFKCYKNNLVFLVVGLIIPLPAYAYLDPGTGNILIYAIISILGTIVYATKSLIYKILKIFKLSKNEIVKASLNYDDLVIFSEGKNYWSTFHSIVKALIEKEQPFTYYTMDIEDPALVIESQYMNSRYIGSGVKGFAKVCHARAKVMLATTPNIGTPDYPMPVPKYVDCLVHVLHGVGDIGFYHKYSLDHYHVVLMMGNFSLATIRHLEKLRHLPEKECIAVGMPCLDELAKRVVIKNHPSDPPIILIAPSWGEKGCLKVWGAEFIALLAQARYQIIIRPHPHSIKTEQSLLKKVKQQLSIYQNVLFDENVDGSCSMNQADLLISDKSGIRFEFAFLYQKPVITLDMIITNPEIYELSDLDDVWEDRVAHQLGPVIEKADMKNMVSIVEQALMIKPQKIRQVIEKDIENFGYSGEVIAEWIIYKTNTILR